MRVIFLLLYFLILPVSAFSEELSEASKQRLVDYRNAVESKEAGRIKETWSALDKDHAAVSYMNEKEPNLADAYHQRRGIEAMNSVHQAQAKRGEIVPFSDIEKMSKNPPVPDRGPVPVSGDPALADLADPSTKHVAGAPAGDPELAALVERSRAARAAQTAPTNAGGPPAHDTTPAGGNVQQASTNFSSGNSPTPGNTRASAPEPLTPPLDNGPIPVSGDPELADLVNPSKKHVQGAPKGDPELAALAQGKVPKQPAVPAPNPTAEPYSAVPKKQPALEVPGGGGPGALSQARDAFSTGGNIVDGIQVAGQAASGINKERQAAAQDGRDASARNAAENIAGEVLGQSAYDAGKQNSQEAIEKAKKEGRPWWSALGDSLKKTGQDMAGFTGSKKVNEEEALKEAAQAKAEGRAPNLGVTGAKGRAAVRVAGDATGMNPIFDAVTYDSEADRAAADMQRRLQQKVKDELRGALDETGMYERGMTRFKGREDVSDPPIRARLRELQGEYAASRARAQATNNRTRGTLDENDPELIALRQAVDLLPENPLGVDMNEKMPPTQEELVAQKDCSGIPNSNAAWNETAKVADCSCKEGYQYNNAGTACEPDRQTQIRQQDCSGVPNSYPAWSEQLGRPWCQCNDGYEAPAGKSSCEPTRQTQVAKADCSHIYGATAYWDNNVQGPMCGCPAGYAIVNNACVPLAPQPQVQQPPPFDPSALINIFNQGVTRQNPPVQGHTHDAWGRDSRQQGGWTGGQLPGLGSSSSSSSSGGSMGWVNQGYQASNSGGSNSPGVCTTERC